MMLGKTNCDEFAMGGSNENSAYGPVRNPVALDRVPGGSSGGSAAAVAADLAVAALGTDTGGSIRQPGSFCGIPGMMPTYGRVSRYGLIAFASSLDRVGPFARNVRDAAAILSVMAGKDPRDSTSADVPVADYGASLDEPVKGMRIGVPTDYFGAGLDPQVKERVEAGIATLERLGLPPRAAAHAAHRLCRGHVLPDRHGRGQFQSGALRRRAVRRARARRDADGDVPQDARQGVRRRSEAAHHAGHLRAFGRLLRCVLPEGAEGAGLIAQDFAQAFEQVDAIVTPTSPVPAFRLGERTADPLAMYLADIYTVTGSLAGVPGISVPAGKTTEGLPVGLQIFGPAFGEAQMLRLAHAFELAGGSAN